MSSSHSIQHTVIHPFEIAHRKTDTRTTRVLSRLSAGNNMKFRQSFVAVMASKRLENRGVMPRGYHCGIQILEKL